MKRSRRGSAKKQAANTVRSTLIQQQTVSSERKNVKGRAKRLKITAELRFIGVVEKADEQESRVRLFPEFCAGLKEVETFSHLIVLYWMHLRDTPAERETLLVFPKRHAAKKETGVFACRSPSRPNPIGLCIAELVKTEECVLTLKGLDAIEGTPVIDIKPYMPAADAVPNARVPEWTKEGPKT